jgi:hypothetical protein
MSLANLALDLLTSGAVERVGYAASALEQLGAALRAHFGAPTLRDEVLELVQFAHFLAEVEGCPKAGAALLDVADTATQALLSAAPPARLERMRRRASAFAQFRGDAPGAAIRPRIAPTVDSQRLKATRLAVRLVG